MRTTLQTVVIAAALALGAVARAAEVPTQPPEPTSAQLRAAYLECDRVSSRELLEPGTMALCAEIARVLLHRDFEGDLDRQLQWWRSMREAHQTPELRARGDALH